MPRMAQMSMTATMRRFGLAALACVAGGLAQTGCDPRVFDDLEKETWVHASEVPDGLSSQVYAIALAGGGQAFEQGTGLFVAGRLDDGLGHLRYDAAGELSDRGMRLGEVNGDAVNPLALDPVLVGDEASHLVALALTNGVAPGGVPVRARVALLDADTGSPGPSFALPGPDPITALDFASTDVTGGARNIALVRGGMLAVLPDLADVDTPAVACLLGRAAGTSMVAADLDPDSDTEEIAFALASDEAGNEAEVVITTGKLVEDAAGSAAMDTLAECFADGRAPLLTISAPAGETDFGRRMLTADFNGNGAVDLAISAPGANGGSGIVYVYLDVDAGAGSQGQRIEIPAPGGARDFGLAMAAGNLDGQGGDELAIGAPGTPSKDLVSAGAVYLYGFADNAFGPPYVLADAQPEPNQRFGQAMAVVPFGAEHEILSVGSNGEVFTYFRTPMSSTDVRQ